MDTEPTPEQIMLRDSTRDFLSDRLPTARVRELAERDEFDAPLWQQGAALGWTTMLVPEAYGGGGAGIVEAAILAEELGRALYPGPFLPVNVVVDAISSRGSSAQKASLLPALTAGTTVATWAIAERPGQWDAREIGVEAVHADGGYLLRGVKRWVQDAQIADLIVVTCRSGGDLVQLLVPTDAPGVAIAPLASADLGRRLADVELHDVAVGPEGVLGDRLDVDAQVVRQLGLAIVLQCAETVGATGRVVEKTIGYARDRVAFGRPIGSFQAVKHLLADAAIWLEAAQAATWAAARSLDDDERDVRRAIHVAKAFVARHCSRIVENCMQVQGGIAMTWEDDCHLYLRRVQSNSVLYRSAAWHADRLCETVGMAS